jgi:hypothetical protein
MARGGEVRNLVPISEFVREQTDDALAIVGRRTRDDARLTAPRMQGKPPGRGSYPREYPGYMAEHIGEEFGTDAEGFRYVDIGGSTPAARTLIIYRGGAGGRGAYGGTRGRDPFLARALEAQHGRSVP